MLNSPLGAQKSSRKAAPRAIAYFLSLLGVACMLMTPAPAHAGADDFEFGQALAKKGQETGKKVWFGYAKTVFDRILADKNRSQGDHNEALYGLALLKRGEALAAASNSSIPYAEVRALFKDAADGVEKFIRENAKHPSVTDAKLKAGETRLNFVQWARDLLGDTDLLADRKTSESEVQGDAREMINGALAYFDALDDGWQEMDATPLSQIARFHWVTCKYFSALIHPPCSTDAKNALKQAGIDLEDFISFFDGQLVAIFAQDFYGLTNWELARCAGAEKEKEAYYRAAVDWFDTCIQTQLLDRDSLRIIARGYLHIAQCCLDAGRVGDSNFPKRARAYLSRMVAKVPPILTTVDGIRSMIAWGRIEAQLESPDKAIEVLTEAKQKAEETGRIWLVNRANREITKVLGMNTGTGGPSVGADVLKSVADDQFVAKNYDQAIGAYQKVIQAAGESDEDLMTYVLPSWEKIARSYEKLGDLLSAALATEPVHAAWLDGRIPRKVGDKNDQNLITYGNLRNRAGKWLEKLWNQTTSSVYREAFHKVRDSFSRDYPGHPIAENIDYKVALQKFNQAKSERDKKQSSWKRTMAEAIKFLERVAKDTKSAVQQRAQVKLIVAEYVKKNPKGMVARADEALKDWDSAATQKRAKEYPTIAARIAKQRGEAKYWKSVALVDLKRWGEVLTLLENFDVTHGDQSETVLSGALGNVVQAYIGKGDIEGASTQFQKLIRQYPDYYNLPKITFHLARYYEGKYSDIEDKYKAALAKLYGPKGERAKGVKSKWRKAMEDENFIAERLIDVAGERNKAKEFMRYWENDVLKEKKETRFTEDDYKRAKWRLNGSDEWDKTDREFGQERYKIGLIKTIDKMTVRLKELKTEKDNLWSQVEALEKEIEQHKKDMYPPLKKAANFYYAWDQVMKEKSPGKRTATNVGLFAYRFYYATVLNDKDDDAWQKALELYTDYMDLPGVSEDNKAGAAAKLGRIYSHLSDVASDATKRKEYSQQALELLQEALAKVPANNSLMVRQLEGQIVVIPWQGVIHSGRSFRFPIARIQDLAGFRRAVKEMGTEAMPLPEFAAERDNKQYATELNEFKKHIAAMSDKEAGRVVKNFKTAGFDPIFFKTHAKSRPEFRLSLARVYAQSNRIEDIRKALNLCYSLTGTALRVDEESEEHWEAQVIKMQAYIRGAEIGSKSGQNNIKAEAKEMLELASKGFKALHSNDPSLGEEYRSQTPLEMRDLLGRLNILLRAAQMTEVKINITTGENPNSGG